MLVEPDVLGGGALAEKQQVGLDAGVRVEHAVGQAHDGVQVAFLQQFFLDTGFDAFAEQEAIRQNQRGAAARLEQLHDQH